MKTLKIQLPIGQTLLQAILLLIIFLAVLEFSARTKPVEKWLENYEFYGSAHPQFDTQLRNINNRIKKEGRIDCVFIGNSQVLYGIDPAIVEKTYFDIVGKKIICQNFGLGGISPLTTLPLIQLIIKDYNPSVIIFGTSLFDYASPQMNGADISVMSSPWLKYQFGRFTVDGWLIENSFSYRYYLGIDHYMLGTSKYPPNIQETGYLKWDREYAQLSIEEQIEYFDTILPRPTLQETQTNTLREIINLQSSYLDIIILEIPFTPNILDIKPRAKNIQREFISFAINESENARSRVWTTQNTLKITGDHWYDFYHLNSSGASYFSKLLGQWLAEIGFYLKEN